MSTNNFHLDFETFTYKVNIIPLTTIEGEDVVLYRTLYDVLIKLPQSLQEDIINNVAFFAMTESNLGQYHKLTFNESNKKLEIVCLNWTELVKLNKENIESVIAHEIAHYHLNHLSGGDKNEIAADDLIESWGFKRAYHD